MLSREKIAALINQFIASASAENNFFGSDDLLIQVKIGYRSLNKKDKEFIQAHITSKYHEAFPHQSKVECAKKYKDDVITGTAIGLAGSTASASIYSLANGQFLIKKCVRSVAYGTFAGAFFYPVLKNLTKTQQHNIAERSINLLREVLGIGTTQKLSAKL